MHYTHTGHFMFNLCRCDRNYWNALRFPGIFEFSLFTFLRIEFCSLTHSCPPPTNQSLSHFTRKQVLTIISMLEVTLNVVVPSATDPGKSQEIQVSFSPIFSVRALKNHICNKVHLRADNTRLLLIHQEEESEEEEEEMQKVSLKMFGRSNLAANVEAPMDEFVEKAPQKRTRSVYLLLDDEKSLEESKLEGKTLFFQQKLPNGEWPKDKTVKKFDEVVHAKNRKKRTIPPSPPNEEVEERGVFKSEPARVGVSDLGFSESASQQPNMKESELSTLAASLARQVPLHSTFSVLILLALVMKANHMHVTICVDLKSCRSWMLQRQNSDDELKRPPLDASSPFFIPADVRHPSLSSSVKNSAVVSKIVEFLL